MFGRQTEFKETVGAPGQVVPKRPAGLSVSPISRSETSLDEFDPERADEFDPQRSVRQMLMRMWVVVQEAEELKHVAAPILPSNAEGESHSVSHLPLRSWCSACVREAEQMPTVSVDYRLFGQLEDRAHDTLPVLIVRDRKGKGIWSRPVPSKGVTHPHPVRALMADLDFMDYRRVILKSDQEPSIGALCDAVKNGSHGEIVPEASPKGREQE